MEIFLCSLSAPQQHSADHFLKHGYTAPTAVLMPLPESDQPDKVHYPSISQSLFRKISC